jgi:hypothetical protein
MELEVTPGKGAYVVRRAVELHIAPEALLDLVKGAASVVPGSLPSDARLISARWDSESHSIAMLVSSEQFCQMVTGDVPYRVGLSLKREGAD